MVFQWAATDVLWLRIWALGGISFFNLIPNYFSRSYVTMGWGVLFFGLNSYQLV